MQPPALAPSTAPVAAAVSAAPPAAQKPETPLPPKPAGMLSPRVKKKIWKVFKDKNVTANADWIDKDSERILQINYDFTDGNWVVVGQEVDPDFSYIKAVKFDYRGTGGNNTLEFKIEDNNDTNVGAVWNHMTATPEWKTMIITRMELKYLWGESKVLDWSRIKLVDFAVSRQKLQGDAGGKGQVEIRRIHFD